MPLAQILLTDTFPDWMNKDNAMIEIVNSLAGFTEIISTTSLNPGDILVWNGSAFVNVQIHGDATLAQDGTITLTGTQVATDGFIFFVSNMRELY